jgi:hypothetical protein
MYPAFLPTRSLQTSVFGVSGITEAEIWGIGKEVAKQRSLTLYGRGDVSSSYIQAINLSLEIDNTPRLHANIIDWPEKKVEQQQRAIKLANKSNLILIPANNPH